MTGCVVVGSLIVDFAPHYDYLNVCTGTYEGYEQVGKYCYDETGSKHYSNDRLMMIRAVAFNTLDFGTVSVMMSARFTYLSSIHPRALMGNPSALASCEIVVVLQIVPTYTPGLNSFVFSMQGMDGIGWAITVGFMFVVFVFMEMEKAVRRSLKSKGADTDDIIDPFIFDNFEEIGAIEVNMTMPKGISKLNLTELPH